MRNEFQSISAPFPPLAPLTRRWYTVALVPEVMQSGSFFTRSIEATSPEGAARKAFEGASSSKWTKALVVTPRMTYVFEKRPRSGFDVVKV